MKNSKVTSTKGQIENKKSSKVCNIGKIYLPKAGLLFGVSQIFSVGWSKECCPFESHREQMVF